MYISDQSGLKKKLLEFYKSNELDKNKEQILHVSLKSGWSLNLKYERNDFEYLKKLLDLKNFIDCLAVPNSKWFYPYAMLITHQDGKSIFNTDFVDSYNQHWSNKFINLPFINDLIYRSRYPRKKVSLENGFLSHFRDSEIIWSNMTIKLKNVIIDTDVFYFMISLQKDLILNSSCFKQFSNSLD